MLNLQMSCCQSDPNLPLEKARGEGGIHTQTVMFKYQYDFRGRGFAALTLHVRQNDILLCILGFKSSEPIHHAQHNLTKQSNSLLLTIVAAHCQ